MSERMAQPSRLVEADVVAALPRLRRYARVLIGDWGRADQLVMETLASAWKKQSTWAPEIDLPTWLFSLLHAAHRRGQRHRARVPTWASGAVRTGEVGRSKRRAGNGNDADATAEVWMRVLRLPVEEREVLMLAAVERLSYQDIATLLDVPVANVVSTLTRARERMITMASPDVDSSGMP
jgi:RNA polymerase sigma-70 factor (ECF subfamily)